jgi:inner membrane protein
VRDLATGPGVPLLWPLLPASVQMPYAVYLGLLVAALAAVAVRAWRDGAGRPAGSPDRTVADLPR